MEDTNITEWDNDDLISLPSGYDDCDVPTGYYDMAADADTSNIFGI